MKRRQFLSLIGKGVAGAAIASNIPFPKTASAMEHSVAVFLDEFPVCSPEIQRVSATLLLERGIPGHGKLLKAAKFPKLLLLGPSDSLDQISD